MSVMADNFEEDILDEQDENPGWQQEVLEHQVVDGMRQQTAVLERAVWWTDALVAYVDQKRNELDTVKQQADISVDQKRSATQQEIKTLIQKKDRWWLLSKAGDVLDYFFGWLFGKKGSKEHTADALFHHTRDFSAEVDFVTMDEMKLKQTIAELTEKISEESHVFKRIHYIRLMSRAKDALSQKEWQIYTTQYEKIIPHLQDGQIILFNNNGNMWNGMLTEKTNTPFAHVGIYYKWKLYHSTGAVWWGQEIDMQSYLEQHKPRGFICMNPPNAILWGKIWETAQHLIEWWIQYDNLWAMSDLHGWGAWSATKFNCGEFVGKVIEEATGDNIADEKDALPSTYATLAWFSPAYMDWYEWKYVWSGPVT